jgi:hypothetical protein
MIRRPAAVCPMPITLNKLTISVDDALTGYPQRSFTLGMNYTVGIRNARTHWRRLTDGNVSRLYPVRRAGKHGADNRLAHLVCTTPSPPAYRMTIKHSVRRTPAALCAQRQGCGPNLRLAGIGSQPPRYLSRVGGVLPQQDDPKRLRDNTVA